MNGASILSVRRAGQVLCFCGAVVIASANARADVRDGAVDIEAYISNAAPYITLRWSLRLPGLITAQTLYRRVQGETVWSQTNAFTTSATQFADATAVPGVRYEYYMHRTFSGSPYNGYGHLLAGADVPPIEDRGAVVLLVDATLAAALFPDIEQLTEDLAGDGWQVIRHDVARTMAVSNVRELVRQEYLANSNAVKAVYVLGHVPVPYSGNIAPDGHSNHVGAWPADVYYAEMNGVWTDTTVSNVAASSPRNDNIPRDGKFDQSSLLSDAELQIGRVDMNNMTVFPDASVTETDLVRRYLNRAHDYRTRSGVFTNEVPRRVLVDDNFAFYGSVEGFANTAYRTAHALCGNRPGALLDGDWFGVLDTEVYLYAYGCGAGSYTSATGVGTSGDFGATPSKAVFTSLFGSFHGDWDVNNNFMRACLASREDSYGLACTWAGRPQWFFHHMALGEPIGYSTRATQNNAYSGLQPPGSSYRQVHIALMGDPTLRLYPVVPPRNARARSTASVIEVAWDASPDTNVLGYYIYRGTSYSAAFERVAHALVTATSFTDDTVNAGEAWTYLVRGAKLESSPGGTFTNLSQGVFARAVAGSGAPFNPGGLRADATASSPVRLTWTDYSDDETGFVIERATTYEGAFTLIGDSGADTNWFDDPGPLTPGAVWRYRVSAVGVNATSAPSAIASAKGTGGFIATLTNILTADISNGTIFVPAQRYGGTLGAVTATYMTANAIARAGRDYESVTNVVVWADGTAGEAGAPVQVVAQPEPRLARSFKFTLASSTGWASLSGARNTTVLLTDARAPVMAPWHDLILDTMTHTGAAAMAEGVIGSTIYGGGIPNNTLDSCRFIHQPMTGNWVLTSFVAMDPYTQNARLALMARNDLNAYGKCVSVCIGNNRITLQSRSSNLGSTVAAGYVPYSTNGVWLRLARGGDLFTALYSPNGTAWTEIATVSLPVDAAALWGMAHSGDADFQLATFSNATFEAFQTAAPVCSNDTATATEDGPAITVDVLANDHDPDGGPLAVIAAGPAAHGTVQVNGGTSVTYHADADFSGTDTFVYVAQEQHGETNGAVVSVYVTPVNDTPVVTHVRLITPVDTPAPFVLGVRDVDDDPLLFTVLDGPDHGALTGVLPSGVYLPAAGFTGLETMRIAVADPVGAAATAMVWITVAPEGMIGARLLAWGYNSYGQLGLPTATAQCPPTPIPGAGPVTAVAAGNNHSIALRADGVPMASGYNQFGGLGIGTTAQATNFTPVASLGGIAGVAAGMYHSLFAGTNGHVWACGYGAAGQLGTGATGNQLSPVAVPGLFNVTAVACASLTSYALDADGCVHAFGQNLYGQIGDGTTANRLSPVLVGGLSNITAIAAGGSQALAVDGAGQAWAWGRNTHGQLGLGTTNDQWQPVPVPGATNAVAVAAGNDTCYILREDGAVAASGLGASGQLGNGGWDSTNIFISVPGVAGAEGVAAGSAFVFVRGTNGCLAAAGDNAYGQLGVPGAPTTNLFIPVEGLEDIQRVAGGGSHSLARQRALTNQPPVAHDATVSGDSGAPIPVTLTASDAEGDALTFMVVDQPGSGVLNGAPPLLTYTSADEFYGTDSFTFVACDWQPGALATVRVVVVPEPAIVLLLAVAAFASGRRVALGGFRKP
ncbi:tandem-95 repeat protein [bacterium]|nr:tandem-95 repeat protein [bacterium]